MGQYVSSVGDVVSHVNVTSVQVSDGGSYTCIASNSAGKDSHSARLNVYGPPLVRSMGSISAVDSEPLVITCPVGGHPIHSITWRKGKLTLRFLSFNIYHSLICQANRLIFLRIQVKRNYH